MAETTSFSKMEKLRELGRTSPGLFAVWESLLGTPPETKKGGSSAELSSNGVWCLSDPKTSRPELGGKIVGGMVDQAVKFIEAWNAAQ